MTKHKKVDEYEQEIAELTLDLQRTRADFENYRKRVDGEKAMARADGRVGAILKILPLIDTIDRAVSHRPEDLEGNPWADGVVVMSKNLDKLLSDFGLERLSVEPGVTEFDPEHHEAVSMEDQGGEKEIVSEVLQPGYLMADQVVRPAMVRVVK